MQNNKQKYIYKAMNNFNEYVDKYIKSNKISVEQSEQIKNIFIKFYPEYQKVLAELEPLRCNLFSMIMFFDNVIELLNTHNDFLYYQLSTTV